MKNLKPNSRRLSLAEAVSRVAYGREWDPDRYRKLQKKAGGGFPVAIKKKLDDAGQQVIELILDAGVSAFGKWYEEGHDNTDANEEQIPHKFLKSGVYPEPLNDTILIDILLDKHSGAKLKGYNFVELDRAEFFAALEWTQTVVDQASDTLVLYDHEPAGDNEARATLKERPEAGSRRKRKPEDDALLKIRIETVIARARTQWSIPQERPTAYAMAETLCDGEGGGKVQEFGKSAVKQILAGTYPAMARLEITPLS